MIEKTVVDYLKTRLTVPVGAQTPQGPPASYVVVERTGGGEKDGLQAAVLALRCTGSTLWSSIVLCNAAAEVLKELSDHVPNVFSARLENGPYNQTDTRTKSYRYTAIFRVYYIEEPSQTALPAAPPEGEPNDGEPRP